MLCDDIRGKKMSNVRGRIHSASIEKCWSWAPLSWTLTTCFVWFNVTLGKTAVGGRTRTFWCSPACTEHGWAGGATWQWRSERNPPNTLVFTLEHFHDGTNPERMCSDFLKSNFRAWECLLSPCASWWLWVSAFFQCMRKFDTNPVPEFEVKILFNKFS